VLLRAGARRAIYFDIEDLSKPGAHADPAKESCPGFSFGVKRRGARMIRRAAGQLPKRSDLQR